jgi:glycosyltransferase involved in cell wall biosynthesis
MPKIVYLMPAPDALTGGNKSACRHVQALVQLGYDAVVRIPPGRRPPGWFQHGACFEQAPAVTHHSEILVIPEDARTILAQCANLPNRKVIHCKNPFYAAAEGIGRLPLEERAAYRNFMTCSQGVAEWIARYFDHDVAASIPSYVEPVLFHPRPKVRVIACMPSKRRFEMAAIRMMFERLRAGQPYWEWDAIQGRPEADAAAALGRASVYLSLARFEGLSMSILEAMASGCVVAGFTGFGAREYTTTSNGLWVEEDDCEAAARSLVQAVALAEADAEPAAHMRDAARITAGRWNHEVFLEALAHFWRDQLGVAPDKHGPKPQG